MRSTHIRHRAAGILVAGLSLAATTVSAQTTWYVDDDCRSGNQLGTPERPFCEIQLGINAARDGDTVLVLDGVYPDDGNLDFNGKKITVRSLNGPEVTIIDCEFGTSTGARFDSNEGPESVLEGFSLIHAEGGSGILCNGASPTIRDCILRDNPYAFEGGGVRLLSSNARFERCVISGNEAEIWGGGVVVRGGVPVFIDCVIAENRTTYTDPPTAPRGLTLATLAGTYTGSTVAWHTARQRYYGSIWPDASTRYAYSYDSSGSGTRDCSSLTIEPRGWNYNPNTSALEVVTLGARDGGTNRGLRSMNTNAQGRLTCTGGQILASLPGLPHIECAPAYDSVNNVFYARGADNVVHVVRRTDGTLVRTFALQNTPPLTAYTIGYNPATRHLITTEAGGRQVFIHDLAGNLIGTDEIDFNAPTAHGVGFANVSLFVYNTTGNPPGWYGYLIRGEEPVAGFGAGGGILIETGLAYFVNCVIAENVAGTQGGGVYCRSGRAILANCLIVGNAAAKGAAIGANLNDAVFATNCTIADNVATEAGGALYAWNSTDLTFTSCIFWNNGPAPLVTDFESELFITYSDVMGGFRGEGNLDVDPRFADVVPGRDWRLNDYRLRSDSPCTDAGDNVAVWDDLWDLDGDGDTRENLPLELDGSPRFIDNEEVDDTGRDDGDGDGIVDMGPYELFPYCVGDELPPPADIASKVDVLATIESGGVAPATAAFHHDCVTDAGGDCVRQAIFAGQAGVTVTINWKYKENPNDHAYLDRVATYRVGKCVREDVDGAVRGYPVAGVRFYKAYPEAGVTLNQLYHVSVQYNALIRENVPEDENDPPQEPDVMILPSGQVQVSADCPDGMVVLRYDRYRGGPLVGLEVLTVTSEGATRYDGPLSNGAIPIGRKVSTPSGPGDYCRAVVIRNHLREGVPVAWQHARKELELYPIRPESDSLAFIVGWYVETGIANCWPSAVLRYTTDWPLDPQLHVIDVAAERGEIPAGSLVDLRQADLYCSAEILYQQGFTGGEPPLSHFTNGFFAARKPGYTVLRIDRQPDEVSNCGDEVFFEVIESYDRTHPKVLAAQDTAVAWPIGTQLDCVGNNCGCAGDCEDYFDDEARTFSFGFLYLRRNQADSPHAAEILAQTGQIFPVNTSAEHGLLEAWWMRESAYVDGLFWPNKVVTYDADWLQDDGRIVIASRRGADGYPDDPEGYPPGSRIYNVGTFNAQSGHGESTTPGWNPNDEHAILLPVGGKLRVWAVRNDNPWCVQTGHPWVLVQYPHPDHPESRWKMGVHSVLAESGQDDFYYTDYRALDTECGCGDDGKCFGGWSEGDDCDSDKDCVCEIDFDVVAGLPIDPLFPVNFGAAVCKDDQNPPQPLTYVEAVTGEALWVDRKGGIWAIEDTTDDGQSRNSVAEIFIWENWAADYGCQPWLTWGPGGFGGNGADPWPVAYDPSWPPIDGKDLDQNGEPDCTYPEDFPCAPLRHVGASFDQSGQCGAIEILHDSTWIRSDTPAVRVLDPRREVGVDYPFLDVDLLALPPHLYSGEIGGGGEWPDRVFYDFAESRIVFRGVMTERDREFLLLLDANCESVNHWCDAVNELHTLSREQLAPGFVNAGASKFISLAHENVSEGWVTFAFQNDQECVDAGLPVSVEVWRVECPPDQGRINVVQPKCPLSEKLILQFSGDAGGEPERLYYQWQWSLDYDSTAPELATWNDYNPPSGYENGAGLREVLIEGASLFTLQDTYWRVRYRGYPGCGCRETGDCNEDQGGAYDDWADNLGGQNTQISPWTSVQLAEGWIKRVIRGLNAFDQRVEEFHLNDAATYVDMIRQAGKRFVDPVPLNCSPDNIDQVGLIELYETVLRRARSFSIDQGLTTDGVTQALLLVSGKISELNMLLGNEAFADAMDPTVGTFADQNLEPASYDPHAVFCFEEQVASLLEEELALLRGRSQTRDPDYDADGVMIATVDNRLPWNFTSGNGQVAYANNYQMLDVEQAVRTYPQGHGDAWGYYLTATRKFYVLLTHPIFDWIVTTEDVLVHGQPVPVGFMYERKLAAAAAARVRTGAALTSLTFRRLASSEPIDAQAGYPDRHDAARAWGLADWGRRAGQGAYLDWIVANALLPSEDTIHEGIQKIDRTTVRELREIAASYGEIQGVLDQADAGLNPLGLAANVVPFSLDPGDVAEGVTHFDQWSQSALVALNNAATAFDYANESTQRLRTMQDSLGDFEDLVEQSELDYKARLIEIFGRPYSEDIGVGGAYPDGYDGPDIFHFDYTDESAVLTGDDHTRTQRGRTHTLLVVFERPDFSILGDAGDQLEGLGEYPLQFLVDSDGLGLVKPESWGDRPEPGEIQVARGEILQTLGRYLQTVERFERQIENIEDQGRLLQHLFNVNESSLSVMQGSLGRHKELWQMMDEARGKARDFRLAAEITKFSINAVVEAIPKMLIAGLAAGGDLTSLARAAVLQGGNLAAEYLQDQAKNEEGKIDGYLREQQLLPQEMQIAMAGIEDAYQEHQQVVLLKQMLRELSVLRVELYTLQDAIQQATGRYQSAVGRGVRLLEQRTAFRSRTADQVTQYRYRDLAFRVFRNDALQKYRSQYDLAARYVLLAAKAYDYETNLLGGDAMGGRRFLDDIARERSLGVIEGGQPYVGNGLAGKLAEMQANFEVLRRELGLSNRDAFQRTFSLRWELFRLPNTTAYDAAWRQTLTSHVVADINVLPVYRQFCQPLLPAQTPEPGIVIPFSTTLASGLNLFGHNSSGDEILPPDRFAIKIQSFNVGLSQSYASPPLNREVHVYLIPAGADIMRVPTDGSLRQWAVLDQMMPVPFPISQSDLHAPDWMPWDTLTGGAASMVHRRRIPTVTACPLTEAACDLSHRLTGRSIWNSQWYLIIPGSQLLGEDPDAGIDLLINGEFGSGVRDIKLTLELYGYSGSFPGN
ncbi:MAG: hypothetical protein DPW13_03495 [Planctomycetes bacterium]|nr:hypothetical protein [Planctomycetota bacterium]